MDQAENLRKIMQQKEEQAKEAARVIAVTSGKGGVGKSSVSVNLAIQFARMGKSVVILDADFGLANVEVMFGVIPKYNLSDLLYNGRELKEIICEGPEGIQFISGGSGIANLANFDKEQVKRLINKMTELEKIADIVIIDTGAGINPSVMEFLISSPETILVTTPEPTSVTDSYALLKALSMTEGFQGKNTTVKMIANRVSDAGEGKNLYEKLSMVVSKFLNINIEFTSRGKYIINFLYCTCYLSWSYIPYNIEWISLSSINCCSDIGLVYNFNSSREVMSQPRYIWCR